MIIITESGKKQNYRHQMIYNGATSTKYLLCDASKVRIIWYAFPRISNPDLFANKFSEFTSVIGMYRDDYNRFIDVFDISPSGDLLSSIKRIAIASFCNAIEMETFDYIPKFYSDELDTVLGLIPIEELILEKKEDSYYFTKTGSNIKKTNW